jgi:hypothetical protein
MHTIYKAVAIGLLAATTSIRLAWCEETIPLLPDSRYLVQTAQSVMRGDSYLVAYFLDEEPSDLGQAILPTIARDVVVARVHLDGRPHYLVERERDEDALPPKYLFRSKLSVALVLSGHAAVGDNFDATFAQPNRSGRMTMIPHSRDEVNREYFVIAYVDEDGQRQ